MRSRLAKAAAIGMAAALLIFSGCGSRTANPPPSDSPGLRGAAPTTANQATGETPLPAESNPPGDIPDTQAFVAFASGANGFRIDAPEGWSRMQTVDTVTFQDKFDGESVEIRPHACPTRDPRSALADTLSRAGGATMITHIRSVVVPAGLAQYAEFEANSAPEPVTGKRVRLAENAYLLERNSRCALIKLWAPKGADNVDQWQRIVRSFRWS
jgi:hypothetical protein